MNSDERAALARAAASRPNSDALAAAALERQATPPPTPGAPTLHPPVERLKAGGGSYEFSAESVWNVLSDVASERARQESKGEAYRAGGLDWRTCADPAMGDLEKLAVLSEELGEVARELCEALQARDEPSPNLRVELIQVAAIAVAWAEAIDA